MGNGDRDPWRLLYEKERELMDVKKEFTRFIERTLHSLKVNREEFRNGALVCVRKEGCK